MKKLFCILLAATLLFCASSSIYAVGETNDIGMFAGSDGPVVILAKDYCFKPCTKCGELAYLECTGSQRGEPTPKSDCSIPRHNEYYPCDVKEIPYGTEGYCTKCENRYGKSTWTFSPNHPHMEYHYIWGITGYEIWGSCKVYQTY